MEYHRFQTIETLQDGGIQHIFTHMIPNKCKSPYVKSLVSLGGVCFLGEFYHGLIMILDRDRPLRHHWNDVNYQFHCMIRHVLHMEQYKSDNAKRALHEEIGL